MYRIEDLIEHATKCAAFVNGAYVPLRPIPFQSYIERAKDALAVLSGKADAVKWTGQ